MLPRTLSKVLSFQHTTRLACCQAAVVPRRSMTTIMPVIHNRRFTPFKPCMQQTMRCFATIPPSVVTKPASTENGIDISEKAVKVST